MDGAKFGVVGVFWWRLAREVEKSVSDFFVMVLLYTAASFDSVKLNGVGWKAGQVLILSL